MAKKFEYRLVDISSLANESWSEDDPPIRITDRAKSAWEEGGIKQTVETIFGEGRTVIARKYLEAVVKSLNRAGQEGWEVCAAWQTHPGLPPTLVLKRAIDGDVKALEAQPAATESESAGLGDTRTL